jgi:hypothetical protein
MPEQSVAERFNRILDDLERITDLGRKNELSRRNLTIGDMAATVPTPTKGWRRF